MIEIIPNPVAGACKTGELNDITIAEITKILGFAPNVDDDPCKVTVSWGFTENGHACGIWDWKGSAEIGQFSTFGPDYVFRALFSPYYSR
jgi:hypothetical protein